MGYITEDLTFPPSFDVPHDIEFACERAEYATNMASRRYLFIGETHTSPFDKRRTVKLAEAFVNDDDVIIVAERDILKDYPYIMARDPRDLILHEKDRQSSSTDNARNVNIVKQILAETAKDATNRPHANPRMVLILFGQEHETHIRDQLKAQTPIDQKILWWSFPSIADEIDKMPVLDTVPRGYGLVGYTKTTDDENGLKRLMTKGRFVKHFSLEVIATYVLTRPRANLHYEVYVKSPQCDQVVSTLEQGATGQHTLNIATADYALLRCVPEG